MSRRRRQVVRRPRKVDETYRYLGTDPRWFVFQLQPQLRETAAFNLEKQNFRHFFPMITTGRGKFTKTEPMFRGYGFVHFNPSTDQWQTINGTQGVIGLLPRTALYPSPVPEGMVERYIAAGAVHEDDFLGYFEEFFPGITQVRVRGNHLLTGRTGLVVEVRDLLLKVSFGGQLLWDVAKEDVEVVEND
ncbi:MAG: hypothetical protein KGO96_10140 [Elusimicrobia bacterium]|nr:hypothetical protein [Elusimicrobiota bacterium]